MCVCRECTREYMEYAGSIQWVYSGYTVGVRRVRREIQGVYSGYTVAAQRVYREIQWVYSLYIVGVQCGVGIAGVVC